VAGNHHSHPFRNAGPYHVSHRRSPQIMVQFPR
jgi:hypothetical protein